MAYNTNKMTVFGGKQKRPNLHIKDMVECYKLLLTAPEDKIQGETFNVGARNMTIMEIAELVQNAMQGRPTIEVKPIHDERSYQVNSDKILDVLGFVPHYTVSDAVYDLFDAFRTGLIPNPMDDDIYYNVKQMHKVWADVYKDAPPSEFDPAKGHLSEIDVTQRGVGK